MPCFYLVYGAWWLFFFWQMDKAEKMCKKENQGIPWILAPMRWVIYKTLSAVQGESRAEDYAEASKEIIYKRYCQFAKGYKFLALIAMMLSLLQCFSLF